MNQLERLPNELLIYLFDYFHTDELYRIFYNLNIRFNNLIKSVKYPSLTISKNNENQIENLHRISPYLYTLILNDYIDINLHLFTNISRLIVINPTDKLLAQFDTCILPNLEHLSIKCTKPTNRIPYLYKMIFSNGFSNLKSYYNISYVTLRNNEGWSPVLTLRILKFGHVNLSIFRSILSICPNLVYVNINIIIPCQTSSNIEQHMNIKQLILRTDSNSWSKDQNIPIFKEIFACLPNLEQLSIHRKDNISIIKRSFIKYDWLSSIIPSYLPLLRRFHCYFHIFKLGNARIVIGPHLKNILNQIIENFQYVYQNRYHARLIID